MKKILTTISVGVMTLATALAQTTYVAGQAATQGQVNGTALTSFLALISRLVSQLVPIAITLAILSLFWFLIKFIFLSAEKPEERSKALGGMGYSILAIFIMVSIWGLVGFIGSVTGIQQGGTVPIPGVPTLNQ